MTIATGRRAVWDNVDGKQCLDETPQTGAISAVASIHGFGASVLRSLILLGVPLHPRCMPLAAWAGSREMLEAMSVSVPSEKAAPGLIVWAARGAYVNLQSRQEEVI